VSVGRVFNGEQRGGASDGEKMGLGISLD
jgi:hypothetical protein